MLCTTIRQSIMECVVAEMKDISIANGYSFDIQDGENTRVVEWRDEPIDLQTEDRGIIVRDPELKKMEETDIKRRLTVEIEFFEVGNTSPAEIRQMEQDIITAMKNVLRHGDVKNVEFFDSEMTVERAEKRISDSILTFYIDYYGNDEWTV